MEDLSNMTLAKHAIVAGSSMAAGNTINEHAHAEAMSGPGSEAVDPIPENDSLDDPNISFSGTRPKAGTLNKGKSYTPGPRTWRKVNGS